MSLKRTERMARGGRQLSLELQVLMGAIIQEWRHRRCHLTPLSVLHQHMLALLGFSVNLWTKMDAHSSHIAADMSGLQDE
jgi:hypothetical protein